MFRIRMSDDDIDEDFIEYDEEQEWEDAVCEDPYDVDDDEDYDYSDEEEEEEREWCD